MRSNIRTCLHLSRQVASAKNSRTLYNEKMDLFNNLDPLAVAVSILSVLVLVLLVIMAKMHFRMKKFLINVDAHNISDSLSSVSKDIADLHKFRAEIENYLSQAEKRLRKSVQSVHTVRFNPFQGTGEGGNQSFATALLNESGDGVIISSLYSRDRVSVFSKPLKDFISEHEMSEEEKEAWV